MAEGAKPSGESQGAEVKVQQPKEKAFFGGHPRRTPCSVLKVSQLLLQAIDLHKGLTLAALKKELGHAGYEVRRKGSRPSSEAPRPGGRGTLLRVSGSDAAGYFRVWKAPKPRRKVGRPRLEELRRAWKTSPQGARGRRRRCPRRKAAKKAREIWRRGSRASAKAKRSRRRAWALARSRARAEARAKALEDARGRAPKEDPRPGPRDEKKPEPEKAQKGTVLKPASSAKSDRTASGPDKTCTKTSTKSEGPRNAVANP